MVAPSFVTVTVSPRPLCEAQARQAVKPQCSARRAGARAALALLAAAAHRRQQNLVHALGPQRRLHQVRHRHSAHERSKACDLALLLRGALVQNLLRGMTPESGHCAARRGECTPCCGAGARKAAKLGAAASNETLKRLGGCVQCSAAGARRGRPRQLVPPAAAAATRARMCPSAQTRSAPDTVRRLVSPCAAGGLGTAVGCRTQRRCCMPALRRCAAALRPVRPTRRAAPSRRTCARLRCLQGSALDVP